MEDIRKLLVFSHSPNMQITVSVGEFEGGTAFILSVHGDGELKLEPGAVPVIVKRADDPPI